MLFTNMVRSMKKQCWKLREWVLELPGTTKKWSFAAICLWVAATLVGGRIAEAAFIAFFYCLAVWTLLCEAPILAEWVVKVGLIADIVVTLGATVFMPGSVSIGYAMLLFGIYFTCFRKSITPLLPGIVARHKERKAKRKADKEREEGVVIDVEAVSVTVN